MEATTRTLRLGELGEQLAAQHLRRAGMVLLDRNWHCRDGDLRGELDLVARDGRVLVFCEVKTRRSAGVGSPAEAVTPRKLTQLRALASAYVARSGLRVRELRIDVVAVTWPQRDGPPLITHLRGVG